VSFAPKSSGHGFTKNFSRNDGESGRLGQSLAGDVKAADTDTRNTNGMFSHVFQMHVKSDTNSQVGIISSLILLQLPLLSSEVMLPTSDQDLTNFLNVT
jgi:hypothetical protein